MTNFADHSQHYSHDQLNRYLRSDQVASAPCLGAGQDPIVTSADGYLLFDDTVADKNYSHSIELVRRRYSSNTKSIIKGVGIVTCVYVNPKAFQFWLIDYRLFAPDADGKAKLDHVREMFDHTLEQKGSPFSTVLMDSWYAAKELMLHIERRGKLFYCPLKSNRQIDEGDGTRISYRHVGSLTWSETEHGTANETHRLSNQARATV